MKEQKKKHEGRITFAIILTFLLLAMLYLDNLQILKILVVLLTIKAIAEWI